MAKNSHRASFPSVRLMFILPLLLASAAPFLVRHKILPCPWSLRVLPVHPQHIPNPQPAPEHSKRPLIGTRLFEGDARGIGAQSSVPRPACSCDAQGVRHRSDATLILRQRLKRTASLVRVSHCRNHHCWPPWRAVPAQREGPGADGPLRVRSSPGVGLHRRQGPGREDRCRWQSHSVSRPHGGPPVLTRVPASPRRPLCSCTTPDDLPPGAAEVHQRRQRPGGVSCVLTCETGPALPAYRFWQIPWGKGGVARLTAYLILQCLPASRA